MSDAGMNGADARAAGGRTRSWRKISVFKREHILPQKLTQGRHRRRRPRDVSGNAFTNPIDIGRGGSAAHSAEDNSVDCTRKISRDSITVVELTVERGHWSMR